MKIRSLFGQIQRKRGAARMLAVLGVLTLMATMIVPFHASAATEFGDLYEGWRHISKDATGGGAPSDYVSYDEATGAFTFDALESGGKEMLFLNREYDDDKNSSADNVATFGKSAMQDFVVEYDVELSEIDTANGGMIEFAFMNERPNSDMDEDLTFGSITAGSTKDHTIFWSRGAYWRNDWVNISGNYGAGDLGGYYGEAIAGTGLHHVKVTKAGWTLTLSMDDKAPVTVTLPSDIGLPETGLIGFYAQGANATISNVKVTNSTTDATATFFSTPQDPEPPEETGKLYEGWRHVSEATDPSAIISYDETSKALTFHAMDSDGEMLYLNRENSGSDNVAKFGKDAMRDFVVEYDIELADANTTTGGQIALAFMSTEATDFTQGSIMAGHTNDHNCFWWRGFPNMPAEYEYAVVGWPDGFLDPSFRGDGQTHRVKVTKTGWEISMSVDGGVPVTVELPADAGLPASGYIGFYAQGAEGTVSNVKVTNSTTGDTAVYFGDGEGGGDNPSGGKTVSELEGWSGFCNQQTEATSHYYQRDGEGALFFDGMYCDGDFLYLNSSYGKSADALDNVEKFGKDAMGDFTVDFDFSLRDMDAAIGGALNFAFGAETEINPGLSSTVLQMNGSATALKYEYAIVENYGLLPDTHPENVLVGTDSHHVTIQKAGRKVTITIDGFAAWDEYTLPDSISSNNSEPDHAAPDSGYMAFWFRNAKGYIANVQVKNDSTGASKTFFEDYGKTLDFWEMGGGDTTNLLAVTPEKGTGVRGESSGESPNNTTLKYILPLDLKTLTFDFVPKTITSSDIDTEAWMGFALTNKVKDYNPENPAKSAGFVAEIQSKNDGKATITFKSLLADEAYGAHTATAEIASFKAGDTYTFGTKYTADGALEVYLNGTKIATLDWLKGVYNNGLGYLTTTASSTDGFPQAWVVEKLNGENAVAYDSGLIDESGDIDDGGDINDEPDNNGGATSNPSDTDPGDGEDDNPATGFGGPSGALWLLVASSLLSLSALGMKKQKT